MGKECYSNYDGILSFLPD